MNYFKIKIFILLVSIIAFLVLFDLLLFPLPQKGRRRARRGAGRKVGGTGYTYRCASGNIALTALWCINLMDYYKITIPNSPKWHEHANVYVRKAKYNSASKLCLVNV